MRALVVTYVFPPVGGAGVQRVSKWVRHLPQAGVTPIVLTAANPSVPVVDPTLLTDVDPEIRIERVRTLEPSYEAKRGLSQQGKKSLLGSTARALLVPDPQLLWLPAAMARIVRIARERPLPDVAVITGPPFSSFLLLPWIRRWLKIPVVLDYRDEWTTTLAAGHDHEASGVAKGVSAAMERALVAGAASVLTATQEFGDEIIARFPSIDPRRVVFLPNGYDPEDLPVNALEPPQDRFVMTYAGTVFRLTSLRGLLAALKILARARPELLRHFELRIYGRVAPAEEDAFEGTTALGVRRLGYVDHAAVVRALATSHVNLCVLDDVAGADRVYPAKIFELMAIRRRCLILAPPGALTRLAERHEVGDIRAPRDAEGIAALLETYLDAFRRGAYRSQTAPRDLARYTRRALATQLAQVLASAATEAAVGTKRLYRTSEILS